jgi:hypothetical protein
MPTIHAAGGPTSAHASRYPLGRGDRAADQQRGDRNPEQRLRQREHDEVRRRCARQRRQRETDGAEAEDAAERQAPREGAEGDRGQPGCEARDGAELPGRGRRDVEVVGHARQHGRQHDHARLGREQAEE